MRPIAPPLAGRFDPALTLLALVAAAGAALTPFALHAPNRIVPGRALALWAAVGAAPLGLVLAAWALLAAAALVPGRAGGRLALLGGAGLVIGLPVAAGAAAGALALGAAPAARTGLGPAFWIGLVAGLLALAEGARRAALAPGARALGALALAAGLVLIAASGALDALSLAKEHAQRREVFRAEAGRHLALVALALGPALLVGLPLGRLARGSRAARGPLYAALSLVQTVPSIALFGLLLGPLAFAADRLPVLRDLGVGGVGAAPAVVALVLYALLPIARAADAALGAVPEGAREAARGLGMGPWRVLLAVELPLALPVLLAGLRVATVGTIGLATVAALVGAGGFGSFVFQGLGQGATDLMLLGALPVIGLALLADALFRLAPDPLAPNPLAPNPSGGTTLAEAAP